MKRFLSAFMVQVLMMTSSLGYGDDHPGYITGHDAEGNEVHYTLEHTSDGHYQRVEHLDADCEYGYRGSSPSEKSTGGTDGGFSASGRDLYGKDPGVKGRRGKNSDEDMKIREGEYLSQKASEVGVEVEDFTSSVAATTQNLTNTTNEMHQSAYARGFVMWIENIPSRVTEREPPMLDSTLGRNDVELLQSEGLIQVPPSSASSGSSSQRLNTLLQQFASAHPKNPQGNVAKSLGVSALANAEEALNNGNTAEAENFMNIATAMLDIALGFIPGVSLGKDAFEAITGFNLVTGEKLSAPERTLSILSVASLGFGGNVATGMKALGKLAKSEKIAGSKKMAANFRHAAKGANRFSKLMDAINSWPWSQSPRVLPGNPRKVIVIGRGMKEDPGVAGAVAHLQKNGVSVVTFQISDEAFDELTSMYDKYKKLNRMPPENVLRSSKAYKENRDWARAHRKSGATIIDIGNPNDLEASVFHDLERKIFFGGSRWPLN